jgi:hypothetical protein
MLLPVLVAVIIQLTTGGVVSTTPAETVGQGSFGHTNFTAVAVGISLHWTFLLPLLASFAAGLVCLVASSRRTK